MANKVFINQVSSFLPNEPVANEEMEDYIGLINGNPSRVKDIVLRQNGIKYRHYALNKKQEITHTNAEIGAAAIRKLFKDEKTIGSLELLACATSIPDQILPSHASMIHGILKGNPTELYSASGVCLTSLQALKVAFLSLKAGDRTITLSNYSTKGCTTNIHKNNQALFLSKDHLIVEESGFTFRSPEDNKYYYTISNSGTFTFGVQFRYLSKASLFNYFWDAKPQQGILQISTCRYIKDISLFLYPDIEWSVSIDIGKQVEFYSHTNMPAGDTYKRHQDKARETGHMRKFNVADMSITLSLEAQYNDGEKESLSFEFGERIKDTLNFWGTLKKGLDTLSFKDKLPTGQSFKPKIGKIPIFIEIESPQIHIEGSWKYNIINNNQLVREGSLTFGLKPLVKGRGGIDVIAALEYIPQAKAIISAIRSANTTLEKGVDLISSGEIKYEASMWFNIYIFGSIECQGSIELSKVGTQELESKTSIGLGVEIGVKAGASTATIIVKGKQKSASIEAALEASAKGETSVSFSGLCGLDNIGPFIELKAIFDGLTITVIGKAQILTRKKNRVSTYGPEINKPYEIIKKTTLAEKRIHFLN